MVGFSPVAAAMSFAMARQSLRLEASSIEAMNAPTLAVVCCVFLWAIDDVSRAA
jgi:hypothetical protein